SETPITIHFASTRTRSGLASVMPVVMAGMMMVVIVIVIRVMAVAMMMIMRMMMITVMMMIVLVVMDALARPRPARVFVEDERFDRHRHRMRRQADAAEIDVVEIPEHDAVDREDVARDAHLLAQDRAERLGDVAVEHDEQRLARGDARLERPRDALGERGDARM